jgi:hypothetical protein
LRDVEFQILGGDGAAGQPPSFGNFFARQQPRIVLGNGQRACEHFYPAAFATPTAAARKLDAFCEQHIAQRGFRIDNDLFSERPQLDGNTSVHSRVVSVERRTVLLWFRAARVFSKRAEVFVRRVARDFASSANDVTSADRGATMGERFENKFRAAVSNGRHRVQVAEQKLIASYFVAGFREWRKKIHIDNIAAEGADAGEREPRVPADVQARASAERVNTID